MVSHLKSFFFFFFYLRVNGGSWAITPNLPHIAQRDGRGDKGCHQGDTHQKDGMATGRVGQRERFSGFRFRARPPFSHVHLYLSEEQTRLRKYFC